MKKSFNVYLYRVAICFPLHIHGSITHILKEGIDIFQKILSLEKSVACLPYDLPTPLKGHTLDLT